MPYFVHVQNAKGLTMINLAQVREWETHLNL